MPTTYSVAVETPWDVLALRLLGSEGEMHVLLNANPDLASATRCPGGVEVVVPAAASATAPAPSSLPPWKR